MPPVSTTWDDSVTNDGRCQLRSGSRFGSPDLLIGEIGGEEAINTFPGVWEVRVLTLVAKERYDRYEIRAYGLK